MDDARKIEWVTEAIAEWVERAEDAPLTLDPARLGWSLDEALGNAAKAKIAGEIRFHLNRVPERAEAGDWIAAFDEWKIGAAERVMRQAARLTSVSTSEAHNVADRTVVQVTAEVLQDWLLNSRP